MKVKSAARPTNTKAPGIHHQFPIQPGETHHDQEREADEQELATQREPVEEEPLHVAELGDVVPTLPPEVDDPEGDLDEPDDRETEHSEQHACADATCCGLPRKADAVTRVDGERPDEHDCGCHVAPAQEALEVPGLVELRAGE